MTKGRLGIIACPMLEDELIASLDEDPEEKRSSSSRRLTTAV